ncbi:hypothetical protein WJX81_005628 [Elliptochloris bilobata]|uniref:Uncharacterized protein n=1 Tax=Elliptochloris bilobata TaxID=381761 RepID=A0AAW1REN7_9CHLO
MGLALWPGGTAEDWRPAYDVTAQEYGLNPCNATGLFNGTADTQRAYLEAAGVVFAAFELKVDVLMAMRLNGSEVEALLPPANATNGTGFVPTLAARATFSRGQLTSLQWEGDTCDGCHGVLPQCVKTAGSQPQSSCSVLEDACPAGGCAPTVYLGFSGDDRHGTTLTTAWQVDQIDAYSLTGLYDAAVKRVNEVLANASATGMLGGTPSVPTTSGDISQAGAARRLHDA